MKIKKLFKIFPSAERIRIVDNITFKELYSGDMGHLSGGFLEFSIDCASIQKLMCLIFRNFARIAQSIPLSGILFRAIKIKLKRRSIMEMFVWTLYYTYTKNGKSIRRVSTINAPTLGRAFQILRHRMIKNPNERITNLCAKRKKVEKED